MSDEGNEYSNGGNGRFDGLDQMYKAGGHPRKLSQEKMKELSAAFKVALAFFNGEGLDPALIGQDGTLASDLDTLNLMREFKAVKDLKEAIDIVDKEASRLFDYMRLAAVPNRFEEEGLKNLKLEGVGRVQLAGDLYAGIVRGREELAFEWLGDHGRGDLVKQTVNSSSLKAVLKDMLLKGEEIPTKLFKAEPFSRASIVKG